jgi:hypothetical protein
VAAIEWLVDVRVNAAPRVGDERQQEDGDGESDGCDGPILLGPLPPPSESAKALVRHCRAQLSIGVQLERERTKLSFYTSFSHINMSLQSRS